MAAPVGISVAPSDLTLAPTPTWTRIDNVYNVQSWQIDRGRPNEMSRTSTGQARVELVDKTGDFDPTNPGGAFYGLGPLDQAAICLQNPLTLAWAILFRGFVSSIQWTPYQTEKWANVTLELVDALAVLEAAEMPPNFAVSHGGDYVDGNIVFNADPALTAVQTRINNVLDSFGWDPTLRTIFTGNVALQKSVYAPRSTVMQVIQDAADSEFPGIANVFIGGPRDPGQFVYHGRYARFHPDVTGYHIHTWQVGDDAAAAASPSTVVRISPPLIASKDDTNLYTSAFAIPQDPAGLFTDSDVQGQYVTSPASATSGLRTWSADNLFTDGGKGGTNGLQETQRFSQYVIQNYAAPKVRVGQLTVKSRDPASSYGAATWGLLCGIDISDITHLKTTHRKADGSLSGGGFDTDFYVEGIHYQARPGGKNPYVELTLDVSPKSYYDNNPWPP